jgi:two-component system, LytTR family, response regulator
MKAIIIDDERLARTELRKLLQEFPEVEVMDEAANAEEGIAKIESQHPDLIFLDIQMPGKTGFDMLSQLERTPQVIFTTAYDEFALKAFEVNALDYLLKPIEPKRLADAIQKLHFSEHKEVKGEGENFNNSILTENDQVFVT